ncbi:MAG: ferritin-like domain-containing protein [Alphaproteobacteria bacterium]|nr:ferritin-like domain-containing protein [Alphaproteobacteria bacterium]
MAKHITHDKVYDTVARDNFPAMLEVARYGRRSAAFDAIIAATHDHFWDPLDPSYVDLDQPFDLTTAMLVPAEQIIELNSSVAERLDEGQRIALANEIQRWNLSAILHGEQGALSLSASLCHILLDPGAQEYAANQAREEARHVTAFSRYIANRWGTPLPVGEALGGLLNELVLAPEVYKKLVGMQMLVEGLAMGAFASLHACTTDPVLKRLVQLVMTDEAFHHRFGKIWAERTIPKLSAKEHALVEDWAARCFETLLFNLSNIRQRHVIYSAFGLDWQWVRDACREVWGEAERRNSLKVGTNIFRVLVKTLLGAGIITDRTRPLYAAWVDLRELEGEADFMVGDAIAAEGIEFLRARNAGRRRIGQEPI